MAHGGDVYRNKVNIDFSVNLNPLGTPSEIVTATKDAISMAHLYPDIQQEEVRRVTAKTLGLDLKYVFTGSGASELIMAVVRVAAGCKKVKALLFEPGFSGYEYALKAAGAEIVRHALSEEKSFDLTMEDIDSVTDDIDMVFICDPNNPTGRRIDEKVLTALLDRAKEKDIIVCLDESFLLMSYSHRNVKDRNSTNAIDGNKKDILQSRSKLVEKYDNLIIITSLTKLFALPGIRMGYVVAAPENIIRIRNQLPEWNLSVTSEAGIKAGMKLIAETDFLARTKEIISSERMYLTRELRNLDLKVYDSDTCFILFQGPQNLYDRLLERGVLIRDCSDYMGLGKSFYRIAVRNHEDNEKLVEAMKEVINEQ